ncbi:MAG: hypothetical protein A2494_02715 [Candidatus Lloydbacteria bacterium RIFOXYC12_FULL_46_25]|uniref:Uncharacterized protein n=1 Tax=Candidatus Lloydbacteria bacterium RIFOXYC12_FULL_46_25 TaxID=1798670 RepID=A0A1G2DTH3_9BACT|nr:MAG: hypothetical protein A2494_02715 [Candidatus Lloydbacteria bacterium RIFOXYC12_FULL_46_25]
MVVPPSGQKIVFQMPRPSMGCGGSPIKLKKRHLRGEGQRLIGIYRGLEDPIGDTGIHGKIDGDPLHKKKTSIKIEHFFDF